MKVTGLKPQVTRPSRISVYIDGRFAVGLSADALLKSGVTVGENLDENRLAELKQLSTDDKAYGRALRYVALRQRSEWEVATYLQRKDTPKALGDSIIIRLRSAGLLDDVAFARSWVSSRRALRATNKRRLQLELQQKHVSSAIIATVLDEDETDEAAVLRELVARKRKIPRYRDNLKLMQYLSRQGYDYELVKTILAEES
jgi:regulatory protein